MDKPTSFLIVCLSLFVFQVVEAMNMNQYPLFSCYLVLLAVCLGFMVLYYLCLKFIKQKSNQDW